MKRAIYGLVLLAVFAVTTDADAQKRRLPTRTEEVPDTESGRPAASAEKPTFKGRLIIYGPPELPLGAPPEHIKPVPKEESVAEPKPEPAPAPIAAPAPVIVPAPVATPKPSPTPPPAQIAVPTPAPPPPAVRIAVPAPTPTSAPVVIVPAPTPLPLAPVAAPIPAVIAPAPIAATAPAPTIAPAPAAAAPPRREVALVAPSSAPAPAAIEAKLIESIFYCLSPGLPQDWKRAWIEITDQGGDKEKNSKFRVSNIRDSNDEGEPLVPCNARELTSRIVALNDKLPPDRRRWTRALLVIDSDGEYELTYDYAK